ncbi:MAG: glutathione S-transferase family protein [Rhodospirillales bacterium]|nr:glutathione S-transferase family protein [Rhodospirillales bacterium]
MGVMVDGVWDPAARSLPSQGGVFVRQPTRFRATIAPASAHPPESGRYRLVVSLACPWAHRTLIMRALKGLEGLIGVSVTHWLMADQGWTFAPGPGVVAAPVPGVTAVHELYRHADPRYTGRVTVPLLWDAASRTIVNNESAEILRILNSAFDGIGADRADYYPQALRDEIDAVNERVYETVNNGVYRAGFATTQQAYEAALYPLFTTLDWLEERLAGHDFLVGNQLTEADIRLFTTLVRFDAVYHGHFKCNLRRLVDYPRLASFARRIYEMPGIGATCDFEHIRRHYYESHRHLNPNGIVPAGPAQDFRSA